MMPSYFLAIIRRVYMHRTGKKERDPTANDKDPPTIISKVYLKKGGKSG